ncbi:MAG: hypothetical protein JW830_01430 [Bacteroidales bacterium]|nr:hypothetical protein [Bacteroidales bacterium]
MTRRLSIVILALLASCTAMHKLSYKIEGSHNALYMQKALVVYAVEENRVLFTNPTGTRCYFLKGMQYVEKWEQGDTLIIDDNLEEFYSLKFLKKCR